MISNTRDTRFGSIPAEWVVDPASQREDLDVELVHLQTFDLPFFHERMSNLGAPSEDPRAIAWQKKIGEFNDNIIATTKHNRSRKGR